MHTLAVFFNNLYMHTKPSKFCHFGQ